MDWYQVAITKQNEWKTEEAFLETLYHLLLHQSFLLLHIYNIKDLDQMNSYGYILYSLFIVISTQMYRVGYMHWQIYLRIRVYESSTRRFDAYQNQCALNLDFQKVGIDILEQRKEVWFG